MKIIDRDGRLFGKISVIDLLVVAVVIVMAVALRFKGGQTHTGTNVTEQPIIFQVRVMAARNYIADAIQVGDNIYDQSYTSGGPVGEIIGIQVDNDPGTATAALPNGTSVWAKWEDTVDLTITIKSSGLVDDRSYAINRVYDLGINSARNYYTKYVQFTGTVASISAD